MKKGFLVFLGLIAFQFAAAQFNFRQHKIKAGDDVYSIAKEYGTTPKAIYNLNPTAEAGIQPGAFLVIPNVIKAPELPVKGIVFKKCKVKRKQTLYGISKKFNVSVDDIKKYNAFIETDGLKKGDILKIPLPAPKTKKVIRSLNKPTKKEAKQTISDTLKTQIYTVKPKETRYGIARKFGITVSELENMNPNLGEDFPIGVQILVPEETKIDTSELSNKLQLYRVPPKQTMYSLSKEFGITIDSIIKLNPEIADGLKADMVIQVPSSEDTTDFSGTTNLLNRVSNFTEKKIAILLPFEVSGFPNDDTEGFKNHLEKSKVTRIVVDFFSGATIAIEKAKEAGINAEIIVADTQKSKETVSKLVKEKNLTEVDAIIGPLYNKNVEKLASLLQEFDVPVFSPISNKTVKNYSNLYQTLPSSRTLQNKIINFIKRDTLPKKLLIIADQKHQKSKKDLLTAFPKAKILDPIEDNFIKEEDLLKIIGGKLKEDDDGYKKELESLPPNWVFLESSNLLLTSNVVSLLSARAKTHKITLFTTNKSSSVYDNEAVSNRSLSNLNFHYPSTNKITEKIASDFLTSYISKYGTQPNSYAIRGHDLMYDVLLRLSASNKLSELNDSNVETEYIENKFQYQKNSSGGLINTSSYIVKYSEGLRFEVVE